MVCGNQVYATNQCVKFADGLTTCFLAGILNSSQQVLSVGGDSGGPVLTQRSGYYWASGIIKGGVAGGRMWALQISPALLGVGATLVLS